MNDEFLYQLREPPAAGFERNLRQELTKYDQSAQMTDHFADKGKFFTAVIAILVSLTIIMTTISPVRAVVTSLITKIAGLSFLVTENYPGHGPDEVIIEPEFMSLADAFSIFPYEIHLPSYLPPGYILNDTVRVYVGETAGPFANTIEISWYSGIGSIYLSITDQTERKEVVGHDSAIKEILLDLDHRAVLVHGGWDVDTQSWDYTHRLRLIWVVDNLTYDLMGDDQEQLTKIASSTFR
jgi:hypothetical protein